ncbi:hypothetical protein EJK17_09005 [Lactobacillus xujianguonis]|uniref:NlpC/P60 domain-containing protein n=1 Tax=Lactobacillus xujianguonis TaxID=2495899 RepID=A0A437STA2_9LACO|nr:hypothetical protein EJK17_09005 [Lactobacillus xujianguonis]
MTDTHEGLSLNLKADYKQVNEATAAVNTLYKRFEKVKALGQDWKIPPHLPEEINHVSTVTASYIQRLQSEGKTYQANKAQVEAYRSAVKTLTNQQEKLEQSLNKIAETSGKTSEEYRAQQILVNKNATEINRFKSSINSLNDEMRRSNPTFMDKVRSKLTATNTEAEKTHSLFKSMFAANIATNAVTSGFNIVRNHLGGMIRSAHEYNIQQQTMDATWLTLTGHANKGKAMVEQIDNMAAAAQNDTHMVDTLSQKFYAINKSPEQTAKLTKSILTLQDAFGKTDPEVENFATQFSQMMANQKVSAQDMLSFVNVFPEYRLELLKTEQQQTHNSKLTMKQFNKLMSAGKISSKMAIDTLERMSNKYKNATDNFTKTIPGMIRTVKSQVPRLVSAFDEPFTKMENPLIKQVSDWATSKETEKAFGRLGKTVSTGFNRVMTHTFTVGQKRPKPLTRAKRAQMDRFLAANAYSGQLPKNQLQKVMRELPKSERNSISILNRKLPHSVLEPVMNGNKSSKPGTLAGVGNEHLKKQLSYYQGLVKAEKSYRAGQNKTVTLTDILNKGIDKLNHGLGQLFNYLSKHGKDIKDIGKSLFSITGTIARGVWKDFSAIAINIGKSLGLIGKNADKNGGSLHAIAEMLNNIAKNKSALKKVSDIIVAISAAKLFKQTSTPFIGLAKGSYKAFLRVRGLARGLKGVNDAAKLSKMGDIEKTFFNIGSNARKAAGSVKDFAKNFKSLSNLKKFGKGLFSAKGGAGKLSGLLQSAHSAKGFKNLSTAGKWGTGLAAAGVAVDAGASLIDAVKNRHSATKRSKAIGKSIGSALGGGIGLWFGGPLGAALGAKIGGIVGKWGGSAVNKFTKGWQRKKPPKKFWSLANLGWSAHSMWNGFTSSVGKTINWFKKHWQVVGSFLLHPFATGFGLLYKYNKGFHKWIDGLTGYFRKKFAPLSDWFHDHIAKPIGDISGKVADFFTGGHGSKGGSKRAKAHARGGLMTSTHGALVGEAGPELAYKPYANHVRLLGANGPQFAKVHAGEKILNARDTHKVMTGGLGRGLVLKGYANGNTGLAKTTKNVSRDYKKINKTSTSQLNSLSKKSKQTWSGITSHTTKQAEKTRKAAISKYTSMRKGVHKQMDAMHDGVISLAGTTAKGFGKELDHMTKYAHSAMSDTIGQINGGIRGIDKVLGQFGGNTSVIKPVKFAKGTDANGRLTQSTYAMVNDATTGPRQEALISDKNEVFMPQGRNVRMVIPKGWGVLNGTQAQQAGLTHFAKGSGIGHNQLKKIAERAGNNPAKSFAEMYSKFIKPAGADLKEGAESLAKNASTHYGNPWSGAMWSVINNAINDGGGATGKASGLLKAVEKNGEGHRYVWGAEGPNTFDCSGLVKYTLEHDFGIDYPHFSGSQYSRTQHISKSEARMGDLVFWGAGGSEHVGVYAGGNKYFSAQSPAQGIHMNTLASVRNEGAPMFGRVKGLKAPKAAAKKAKRPDSRLTALAKRELGPSALKWIKDNLGDTAGGSFGNPAGDGVQRWKPLVKKALGVLNLSTSPSMVSRVLAQIATESSGNPKAMGGTDGLSDGHAEGLMQVKPPTFNAYKLKGHGNIWNGYDNMLAGLNYAKHRYGQSLYYLGQGHGYAKGGKPKAHTPFIAGEQGPELITADGPVKVDTHEQTKRKFAELGDLIKPPKVHKGGSGKPQLPPINININGPISSEKDANKVAQIVKRELATVLENIGDEFGGDPTVY